MLKGRRARFIIAAVVLVAVVAGYYGWRGMQGGGDGALKASGTIEATTVNVSPELAGKVAAVLVEEGQAVKAGEVLFRLDDTLLKAQYAAAQAGLVMAQTGAQTAQAAYASAQAQYTLAETAARAQARPTRLLDWTGRTPDYFDQPKWYFTQAEQIGAAQGEVSAAEQGLQAAEEKLSAVVGEVQNAEFVAAEGRLNAARQAYLVARQVQAEGQAVGSGKSPDQLGSLGLPWFAPGYKIRIAISKQLPDNVQLADAAQTAYDAASSELTAAERAYDELLTTDQAQDVLKARAVLSVANERYQVSQEQLSALQTGEQSLQVAAAAAGLEQAKNAAQQGQDAVVQAQANLSLLEAQLGKLEVRSPMDGVVLTRNIEPGEYVAPGAAALSLGDLTALSITVYVPEDRYGAIRLGQGASVRVDSFPEDEFGGQVTTISDQAEFTPRNVQTVEGRSSTVYAIKLSVTDPEGRLKPGMPADVIFAK